MRCRHLSACINEQYEWIFRNVATGPHGARSDDALAKSEGPQRRSQDASVLSRGSSGTCQHVKGYLIQVSRLLLRRTYLEASTCRSDKHPLVMRKLRLYAMDLGQTLTGVCAASPVLP